MGLLMRQKMDLARIALADVPEVAAARSRAETARAALEAAQQALRACQLAQGGGDQQASTDRRSFNPQEARRQRRLEEPLRDALADREIEWHDATRGLAVAEKDTRAEILSARHPGLKALTAELFERLASAAEVNQRVFAYELTTAALLEQRPMGAVAAWPELLAEPLRESLIELRERLAREAGLL